MNILLVDDDENVIRVLKEKLDWEFIRWVLHDQRTQAARARYDQVCAQYRDKVIVVKNQRQLDDCEKRLVKAGNFPAGNNEN